MIDFASEIGSILPELIEFRHDLHRHPELAFEEHRTSDRVAQALGRIAGMRVRRGVAGTGIVATLSVDKPGRCVALRGDMDALPIRETNTFDYRSQHDGKMHACGHDGHTTCLLGAARVLSKFADRLPGKVTFVFQPAEEGGGGGRIMVEQGALDDPKADAAFALHGWPMTPLGAVIVGSGPVLAATGGFEIVLRGSGTHAAYPHLGCDLIVAAANLITRLQAISARFINPLDPVIVSIGSIRAGHTHNVLPDECRMLGTIRSLREETHRKLRESVERIATSAATDFGAKADILWAQGYPSLVNDGQAARLVADVAREYLGTENVDDNPTASMGGEDFAYFAQRVPSAFWRLGVRPRNRAEYPSLHQPDYDFGDDPIAVGVEMHCRVAEKFLRDGLPGE